MIRLAKMVGIRGQFLVLLGTVIVFVTVFESTLAARSQRDSILKERQLRGMSVLRSWSSLGRERLLSDESVNLSMWDFVDDLMHNEPSVEEVFLLDTNGIYMMHNVQGHLGKGCPRYVLDGLSRLSTDSVKTESSPDGDHLRFQKVISASGKRLGYAVVVFSAVGINQGIKETLYVMTLGSALIGLVGLLMASVLVYQVSRPIKLLVEGVKKFGQTFDPHNAETARFKIDFKTYNEIGDVRDSFNEMTDALHRNMLERQQLKAATGELRKQATTDAMTGLLNKRQFQEDYPVVLKMAAQRNRALCLMSLDMDRFKQLNDTLGHAAGDKALIDLADSIRAKVRSSERAYRIGGDEFILIAVGAGMSEAKVIAEGEAPFRAVLQL
ncbi:MAG: diguanylate cyclase, partial [Fibrobacterota bacterium]